MDNNRKFSVTSILTGAVIVLFLLAVMGLFTVYYGIYNIAATEEHSSITRWAFDTTFQKSIKRRADEISAPEITDLMIEAGAQHYKTTCQMCHSGPGAERAEWATAMRPRPPHLAEEAAEWKVEEIFWLVKHGAKMTGMPAFGPTHDDETIWSIAAFVKELPAMPPEQYREAGRQARHGSDHYIHNNEH